MKKETMKIIKLIERMIAEINEDDGHMFSSDLDSHIFYAIQERKIEVLTELIGYIKEI